MDNSILEIWNDIRCLVESIDIDVRKNAAGNASAGVRARKGMRNLKVKTANLIKITVENEKLRKTEKDE